MNKLAYKTPPCKQIKMAEIYSLADSCCCQDNLILILEDLNTIPSFLCRLYYAKTTSYRIINSLE